jgi:hypothetical protein
MQTQEYRGFIKRGHFVSFNGDIIPDSDEVILTVLTPITQQAKSEIDKQVMLKRVRRLCGIVPSDIDEKAELAEAREEKYGSVG